MLKALRRIVLCAFLLPLLLVTAAAGLAFYALETEPLVRQTSTVDYATVAAGKSLLQRINRQVESAGDEGITMAVSETELRQFAQMGSHTFRWFHADLNFDSSTVHSRVTLQLPANPFGEYLNLGFQIGQSNDGIGIDRLSIGPLAFSGSWLLPLAARLADRVLQDQHASLLLASVYAFQIKGDTALLSLLPPRNAKENLKEAVRELQASRFPPGEEERVAHYYGLLVSIGSGRSQGSRSFNDFLTPLMAEAMRRREHSSADVENRAVIWALTMYFSNGAFEALVGKLVSNQRALTRSPANVTLGGREDLMAHFLYSAGITLATQQGIGIAAGEFKELLDSGNSGSGFSFADLAADRAGIRFVNTATASDSIAQKIQQRIIDNDRESAFFPDISGLVEGLSEAQFRQQFESVDTAHYRKQVALIDERIDQLPIYVGLDSVPIAP